MYSPPSYARVAGGDAIGVIGADGAAAEDEPEATAAVDEQAAEPVAAGEALGATAATVLLEPCFVEDRVAGVEGSEERAHGGVFEREASAIIAGTIAGMHGHGWRA